jgi:hypothetical protein
MSSTTAARIRSFFAAGLLARLLGCAGSDGSSGSPDAAPDAAPDCPASVICVDSLPFARPGTTKGAASTLDAYPCDPGGEASGPEVVYRADVAEEGLLALDLVVTGGARATVHLLSARDATSCLVGGGDRAAAYVQPGRYWITVDTKAGSPPVDYSIRIALTTPSSLATYGMSPDVARAGLRAFGDAWKRGDSRRLEYGLCDFSLHSSHERLWIVDLGSGELLWKLFVAHGEGSADATDPGKAVKFSNVSGSYQSSLGMLRVAESYEGTYGHSARLDGLETGFDDQVRARDIVLHPWTGSRPTYVKTHGLVAVTQGCPGIDDAVAPAVVDRLANGALLWFWYPDGDWSVRSTYLR